MQRQPTPAKPTMQSHPYVRVPSYLERQGARPASPRRAQRALPTEMSVETADSDRAADQSFEVPADDEVLEQGQIYIDGEPVDGRSAGEPSSPDEQSTSNYPQEPPAARLDSMPTEAYEPGSVGPTEVVRQPTLDQDGMIYPAAEAARTLTPEAAPQTDEDETGGDPVVDHFAEPQEMDSPIVDDPADTAEQPLLPSPQPADESSNLSDESPAMSVESPAPSDEPTAELPAPDEPLDALAEPEIPTTDRPVRRTPTSDVLFTSESPVLSVKARGPRTVLIGNEAEFLVRVRNDGAAANDVVVSIRAGADAEVTRADATAGSARASDRPGDVIQWTIHRLEASSTETLKLKLVPRSSAPLDLAVDWTFRPETSQTMVEVQEPKLAMNLSGPTEVLYGDTKIYKLTVSNPGNGDTHNVSLGLVPLGRSTAEASANHTLGTLTAGESKTIDVELTARQAGAVSIKAHAFADGGLRAEAAQQVHVRRASLQVEVEAPRAKYAGTAATYRVQVENTGDATANNVQLSAVLPPQSKFLAASGGGRHEPQRAAVSWHVGPLQPGGRRLFELRCALAAPGENRMQFTAAADRDLNAATSSSTQVEAIADLKLEVRDPQGPVAVGDEAVYEVSIRNRGTKAAEGVELAVFFSEGLEATAADGGRHEIGVGQVLFQPIDALAAGETTVFQIRTRAEMPGNHVFRAEVNCKSLGTKLATEEATHFYGELRSAAAPAERQSTAGYGEPTLAKPPAGEPTPADPNASYR